MMKILVTGSDGLIGTNILPDLSKQFEIVPAIEEQWDILDRKLGEEIVRAHQPDVLINLAAITNVDGCEDAAELAYRVNTEGAGVLADLCKKYNVKLLHFSTDYVFDGTKGSPYIEEDLPNPINAYGVSKLAGENAIRHQVDDYVIIRTQWLIGLYGRNFVSTIISAAQINESIRVVNDQWGSPTFAFDLAKAITQLMEIDARGIFHVCNRGKATWYDLASRTIEFLGLGTKVIPISTKEYPLPAIRPAYSILSTKKFTTKTGKLMPIWQASLENFVHEYLQHAKGTA